jgi:hypothetical protein
MSGGHCGERQHGEARLARAGRRHWRGAAGHSAISTCVGPLGERWATVISKLGSTKFCLNMSK